tara:strand:- start:683 stop:913 length:231 start_codon:yes stop_codon:yes gene_type:complete
MGEVSLTRDEIGSLILDGLKYRMKWAHGRNGHVHFDTDVRQLKSGEVKEVIITATVSPLYGEDELLGPSLREGSDP